MQHGDQNPLFAEPQLKPGTVPGELEKLPLSHWEVLDYSRWVQIGETTHDWSWFSPLFDLRPEFARTDPNPNVAVPINRSAALGSGVYMRIMIIGQPANFGDTRWFLRMEGNDHLSNRVFRLTEEVDITGQVQAGGLTNGTDIGASVVSCEPPGEGIRFWRVVLRARQTAAAPRNYELSASVY